MRFQLYQDSLKPDDQLQIKGKIPQTATRFSINMGKDDENLAFHCEVRFDQGSIVLNTKQSGKWHVVEIRDENPFKQGGRFEVAIKHNVENFEVTFPHQKIMHLQNRLGIGTIPMININGDFEISDFSLID